MNAEKVSMKMAVAAAGTVDWIRELAPAGKWIWHAEERRPSEMAFFFHEFVVPEGATGVQLLVSGDHRYVIYVDQGDGPRLLGRGPARSDIQHYTADPFALDLEPQRPLRIWAMVRHVGAFPMGPLAEMHTPQPGFLCLAAFLDGQGHVLAKTGTGKRWKAFAGADAIVPYHTSWLAYWMGHFEAHHACAWPEDWLGPAGPTSSGWHAAREENTPYPKGDGPWPSDNRWLVPREIPQAESYPRRFVAALQENSPIEKPAFPIRLESGQKLSLLLDAGENVMAYPRVEFSGPGSHLTLSYAEVLMREVNGVKEKVFALEPGCRMEGTQDKAELSPLCPEGRVFPFETFHWRSFRFVRLEITAGARGAVINDAAMTGTGYPLECKQTFAVEGDAELDKTIQAFMDVSWRTMKLCTWETYMDCPYYEQLQYLGDTRLQALLTYTATGDPTLPIQALRAFDHSRISEGITQSRYPSAEMQLIPTFSLIYVLMLDDYLAYVGDDAIAAELRPGVSPILSWFTRYIDPKTGLIGKVPYWPFVDWVKGWDNGVPPVTPSCTINLHYLLALQAAGRIYEAARPGAGELYLHRAKVMREKIREAFFDEGLGGLLETPKSVERERLVRVSQHAQALGTLAEVLKPNEARQALRMVLDEGTDVWPASFYFRFYLAEALAKVGMGGEVWKLLEPFRDAIARGSTTWPESFEPCRSECHAWSAWPMYFFARHVLGVSPPDPIDGRIDVKPLHCPPLEHVKGTVMTHRGLVRVEVEWKQGKAEVKAMGPNVRVREGREIG